MWAALFKGLFSASEKQGDFSTQKALIESNENIAFMRALNIGGGSNSSQLITLLIILLILGLFIFVAVKSV